MRPAVDRQPQADGVGDGLGNIASGRIGHPRGDPLVVIHVVRTHYPGPAPARTTPTPRPIPPAPPRRSPPVGGPPGEKGSVHLAAIRQTFEELQDSPLRRENRRVLGQCPGASPSTPPRENERAHARGAPHTGRGHQRCCLVDRDRPCNHTRLHSALGYRARGEAEHELNGRKQAA